MSGNEIDFSKIIWSAVRTGAITMLAALVLLLPVSWLIYTGSAGEGTGNVMAICAVALSAFASQWLVNRRWGGGGMIGALLGSVVLFILMLLLTAGMKDARWNLSGMLPAIGAGAVGMLVGSLIKFNKKYTKRKSFGRRYNK